jgi:hypothetical protein
METSILVRLDKVGMRLIDFFRLKLPLARSFAWREQPCYRAQVREKQGFGHKERCP